MFILSEKCICISVKHIHPTPRIEGYTRLLGNFGSNHTDGFLHCALIGIQSPAAGCAMNTKVTALFAEMVKFTVQQMLQIEGQVTGGAPLLIAFDGMPRDNMNTKIGDY